MSDAQQHGSGAEGDFDLTQFYQIFFEEAAENLDLMEQMLLSLQLETADDEDEGNANQNFHDQLCRESPVRRQDRRL